MSKKSITEPVKNQLPEPGKMVEPFENQQQKQNFIITEMFAIFVQYTSQLGLEILPEDQYNDLRHKITEWRKFEGLPF